jgi:hypothetical protein
MNVPKDVKELAKDRKHAIVRIDIDRQHCAEKGGSIEFCGPVDEATADEVRAFLLDLLKRGKA